ncbi:DNA mismatch repair protein MutS [Ammonifex degensii KC4]|uniref:DNA mismatch repair protein MutS n=1 Tax=Ammonifex degensii (strain DSM 10501 / KC4) TaxID=429009 RepID=C9R9M6_AMMDK|nr:DNA mismatch repair protein MutS [Ammonifex degensii]ACX53005.1 DNA mismatch repair protein MutS [Ammonifex degensii KC4]
MSNLTPMMQQYLEIKKQYPDAILFFHLGDFYEMFFEDAVKAAPILEVALTSRDAGRLGRVPMCGVPCHSASSYIARLVSHGFKVALCEQLEDPSQAKGLVKRGVTRVITPGTFFEGETADKTSHSYVVAVAPGSGKTYGLASAEVGTGEFRVTSFTGAGAQDKLMDELFRLQPAEVVLPEGNEELKHLVRAAVPAAALTFWPQELFRDLARAKAALEGYEREGEWETEAVLAAGVLAAYLAETQKRELKHLKKISSYRPEGFMLLDAATRRNLELTRSLADGSRRGTLLEVLDYTLTGMGGRRLRDWIEQPLLDPAAIEERLEAVAYLVEQAVEREEIRARLKKMGDIERLASRLSFGLANARDLLSLKDSLILAGEIKERLSGAEGLLGRLRDQLENLDDIASLIAEAIAPDPPATLQEGGLIREGYHPEVDRLRAIRRDAHKYLAELEAKEKERTGIKSLKIGYNRVFGYYIEVTKPNLHLVPPDYQRRQTLTQAERFITPELKEYEEMILGAEERLYSLEYELFCQVRDQVQAHLDRILRAARAIGQIDALASLAVAALKGNYVRPRVSSSDIIRIKEGRHPVVERALGPGNFVPNDTWLGGPDKRVAIITGPNMGGKSTYMRQVALIVLMAQIGSFVPAAEAEIGVVDRIFTRVGAADNLYGGQSTFMVEMGECRTILTQATSRSLVVMDEVGRGTSTYDGMSIARAIVEYLVHRIKAKTLFSTHYHELTDLARLPGVFNLTVAVREEAGRVSFLYRVLPGKADKSYGLHVAALAGLPKEVIERAKEILEELERRQEKKLEKPCRVVQLDMFSCGVEHPLLAELARLDLDQVTPLQALNLLAEWQERLKAEGKRRGGRRRG